jgi:pyruvate-formate lyase-activating enzyme
MASWGCKTTEIADWFLCDVGTITGRFSDELTKGRIKLKTNLRQWQIASARGGNVTMQIWLGKQLLGQTDKIEQDITAAVTTTQSSELTNELIEIFREIKFAEPQPNRVKGKKATGG